MNTEQLQNHVMLTKSLLQLAMSPVKDTFIHWGSDVEETTSTQPGGLDVPANLTSQDGPSNARSSKELLQKMQLASKQLDTAFVSIDTHPRTCRDDRFTEVLISAWARDKNTTARTRHFLVHSSIDTAAVADGPEILMEGLPPDAILANESEIRVHARGMMEQYLRKYSRLYTVSDGSRMAVDISDPLEDASGKICTVEVSFCRNIPNIKIGPAGDAFGGKVHRRVAFEFLVALTNNQLGKYVLS